MNKPIEELTPEEREDIICHQTCNLPMWAEIYIEDKIEEWHTSNSNLSLHEYLGWSADEYAIYIETSAIPERELKER